MARRFQKMDDLTYCTVHLRRDRRSRGRTLVLQSPSAQWLHTLDGCSASLAPSFSLVQPPALGRTTGKRKQPLTVPHNQAVSLQVCLILDGGEISRLRCYNSISLCQYRTSAGSRNLRVERSQQAAENLVAMSQSIDVQNLRTAAVVLKS